MVNNKKLQRLCREAYNKYLQLMKMLEQIEGTDREAVLTRVQICRNIESLKMCIASFVLAGVDVPEVKELFVKGAQDIMLDPTLYLEEIIKNTSSISVKGYLNDDKIDNRS